VSATGIPRVRVGMPTFRRPDGLARALASLRAQTRTDWVADVRNDDPEDPRPAAIVAGLGDPRIRVSVHPHNLGPIETFNRLYAAVGPEPFFALLEDDATWEPAFLATLGAALESRPAAALVWCNQRVLREEPDGTWHDTGRTVRPPRSNQVGQVQEVDWGAPDQATGARHANGAMLLRRAAAPELRTPTIPFAGVEAFRERLLPHPLLYVSEPLATYGETRLSARSEYAGNWAAFQTLLLGTFVRHARLDSAGRLRLWTHLRAQRPAPTNLILHAALGVPGCSALLREARAGDVIRYLRSWARRPSASVDALRAWHRYPSWRNPLDLHTAERFAALPARRRQLRARPDLVL
jgi:glycosyltransferase involved in cell wall biosynthesis